jgi:AAA ATPase domain
VDLDAPSVDHGTGTVARREGSLPVGDRHLLGRASQLRELAGAVEACPGGTGGSFLVEGEAGFGKTSLVEAALAVAGRLGLQVFRATAEELERRRPFGTIVDCLGIDRAAPDPRRAEVARVFEEVRSPTGWQPLVAAAQGEFRAVEAILTLVEELSAQRPLVLAVDDLQWADPSTLLVLHRLGRVVERLPVLLLAAYRPLPRPPDLERLIASLSARGARRLALGSLDEQAVAALVERLVGAAPGPRLLRQVAGAGGNPLFVTELVAALTADGSIEPAGDGQAEVAAVGLPPSLPLTILHRLSFLPQQTLDVLRAASVIGASFSVAELSRLTGTPSFELLAVLRESLTAGVLGEEPTRLRFRHDLLREALYQDLPGAVRAGLHRDAARALAGAGAPAEQVAEHLLRGAAPGDVEAVAWLREAATTVASHAPAVAVDLLRRALEPADPADPTRDAMLAELAVSLMWSGGVVEAEQLCRQVLGRGHHRPWTRASGSAWPRRCWPRGGARRRTRRQPGPLHRADHAGDRPELPGPVRRGGRAGRDGGTARRPQPERVRAPLPCQLLPWHLPARGGPDRGGPSRPAAGPSPQRGAWRQVEPAHLPVGPGPRPLRVR